MQEDCIFCKIIRNEIPSSRIYSDDQIIAFLDLAPTAKGHTLVVPRAHYATMFDVPPELGGAVLSACQRVGRALMDEFGAGGINVGQNNFAPAGQMVFHVHWHVIPRFEGDGFSHWAQGAYSSREEMAEVAQRLSKRLTM